MMLRALSYELMSRISSMSSMTIEGFFETGYQHDMRNRVPTPEFGCRLSLCDLLRVQAENLFENQFDLFLAQTLL